MGVREMGGRSGTAYDSSLDDTSGNQSLRATLSAAMEEANGKSLKEFFAKWVYLQS
jgi:hypothetical protein